MGSVVVWNEANFDYCFHSWDGMTGRYIKSRSERLAQLARSQAGVRTGALKASIGTRYTRTGKSLTAKVGANVNIADSARNRGYGYYHHEGTLPHVIRAKNGKALRFSVAGNTLYRASVRHPGTKPNPYLTQFLKEVTGK